jgi:hypothetical protein
MVSAHAAARDVAQAGVVRMIGALAVIPPCIALIQVLAGSRNYCQPAVAVAVWLAVLGAARWLVPRLHAGGLSARETAAAIAIAIAAVAVVVLARRPQATPGSVDLAILGTIWLLVLVAVSRPAVVWIPAALSVFAVHSALLIRTEGLSRLSLSEIEAAAYITAAILIAFASLRPTLAVHLSMAARRSSLTSKAAAERAAAAAIGQERRSRLAVLEKDALPLLRGIADGTLDANAADVRDSCARHAAALRHSLTGRLPAASGPAAGLDPALRAARERGLVVEVQLIGDPGAPPGRLAHALLATVDAVLGALPPQEVRLTVLADSGDPDDSALNGRDSSGGDPSDADPKGNDVELFLTFDAPPASAPDLTRFGRDLPATARWRAAVRATEDGGGFLEVSWRKDGAR